MALQVISEPPVRITQATVDAAWRRRARETRTTIRDTECRGLALVVNPAAMAWVFSYKPRGNDPLTGRRFGSRAVTIGNPSSHSPAEARREAGAIKAALAQGGDPAGERKEAHRERAVKLATTMDRLVDLYAEALPSRPKMRGIGRLSPAYVATELMNLRAAVATMKAGGKAAADLGTAELRGLLRAESGRAAVARQRFGAVERFFDWCLDEGHVATKPTAAIGRASRPKPPPPRTRTPKPEQVAVLWKAAERMKEAVHRDFARFLMAVPCRRNEAARMEWGHLDLAAATWDQPGRLTKNGDPHRLHLPKLARDILSERHERAGRPATGIVFPPPRRGRVLTTFSAVNAELDELAGFTDWAWHDLRRTFATALGEAGIPETVADAVLNHRQAATRGGVMGVYQLSVRWPERQRAMDAWCDILAAAIEGRDPPGNVADLAAARAAKRAG